MLRSQEFDQLGEDNIHVGSVLGQAVPAPPVEHLVLDSSSWHCFFTDTGNDVDCQHDILQLDLEWDDTTRQLPEDDAQTINVAFGVVGVSGVLHALRCYIGNNAKQSCFGGVDGFVDRLAETKVCDESLSASVDEDVA